MIVDAHLHLFERQSEQYPRGVHPLYPPELRAPLDEFVEVMDRHGVDRAVVVPLDHHDEYLEMVLNSYPDRFRGVGVLDEGADAVASTRRRHRDLGIVGLRVGRLGAPGSTSAGELELLPLLAAMTELRMVLWFYGPPEQLELLPLAMRELPELRVVLNHLGFCPSGYGVDQHGRPRINSALPPPTLSTACGLAGFANVNVMFSGQYAFSKEDPPFPDLDETVHAIGDAYGFDRLLWASDWPWIKEEPGYGVQMRFIDHFFPEATPDERAKVMGDNAARLLGFEAR